MALTDVQQAQLQVLTGPAAWATHQALPADEQVNPEAALAVYGTLLLVAADVLDAAASQARTDALTDETITSIQLGPIKLGGIGGGGAAGQARAAEWAQRAASLRAQARRAGFGGSRTGSVSIPAEVTF